jgi:Lipase (class 3)
VTPQDPQGPAPLPLVVSGGRGRVAARLDDMVHAAELLESAGGRLLEIGLAAHRALADPDVAASALLDPAGAAAFEGRLLGALDGPHGLVATAGAVGVHGLRLRATARAIHAADEARGELVDGVRWLSGAALPFVLPDAVLAGGALLAGELVLGRDPGADLQRLLSDHPELVDDAVGALPGFISSIDLAAGPGPAAFAALTGRTPFPLTVAQAAGLLDLLYPDGRARVTDLGLDASVPADPPRGAGDLLRALDHRNGSATGPGQGEIDVRIVERTLPDGTVGRSYIVDIPGTKDWHPVPGRQNEDLNDLGTNLRALAGDQTSYERGVAEALRLAGARPDDPVMLVGHSQGGMVAMRAADDLVRDGTFRVTNVVTAGAPVVDMPVPPSVQVLSLENAHDIVPHLDGHPNPDLPNRTTVTFDAQRGGLGANHAIPTGYQGGADAVDASDDPSVRGFLDSAAGFFAGDRVTTHAFRVTRDFGPEA